MINLVKRPQQILQHTVLRGCHFLASNKVCRFLIGGLVFSLFIHNVAYADGTGPFDPNTDMLSGARKEIDTQFGAGSTFMYAVYFIEVILGIAAYIKTKNPLVFAGLIVIVIFTTAVFAKLSTK